MYKIGIDFGTTNSTISYINPSTGEIECFKLGGVEGSYYIPSFIAYYIEDNSIIIGEEAKLNQAEEDYEVYSRFKMLLGENNRGKLLQYFYDKRLPKDCARDYLKELLNHYNDELRLKKQVENVVVTVPEIWVKEYQEGEQGYLARDQLRKICSELDLPLSRLVSEPVAASAYFAYCYRRRENEPFNGYVLIFDYGGGTLDLSLSEVQGDKITVLERTGKGYDPDSLGKAGIAFDEATIKSVYEEEKKEKLSKTSPEFLKVLHTFEKNKIAFKATISKNIDQYTRRTTANKKLFSINEMPFYASALCEVYKAEIEPVIEQALSEMEPFFNEYGVKTDDRDKFRVIMVGGFSSFYLVQKTVQNYFKSDASTDRRFDSCFTLEDTALAISKGAALIANGIIDFDKRCSMEVGLKVLTDIGGTLQEKDIPILKKGTKISEYANPIYLKGGAKIDVDPTSTRVPIVIYLKSNDKKRYLELEKTANEILPNISISNNKWKVGFSVDENENFVFHAEDMQGDKKETSIGYLMQRLSGIILEKE